MGIVIFFHLWLCITAVAQQRFATPGASIIDPFKHSLIFSENFNTVDPASQARLAKWLLCGSEGNWNGHLKQSLYHLVNNSAPNEANYLITAFEESGSPARIAEVKVNIDVRQGTVDSGAGLIYSSSLSGDTHHAFILQRSGRYAFLKKDRNGFQVVQSGEDAAVQPYVFNSLSIESLSDNRVDLFINGRRVGSVQHPNVGFQGEDIGLLAVSTGYFSFGSLAVAVPFDRFGRPKGFDKGMTGFPSSPAFPQAGASRPSLQQRPQNPKTPGKALPPSQGDISITAADVAMAKQTIKRNTMTVPGMAIGSKIKMGPGDFSASDALVIYMIKFHQRHNICPPISVVAEALQKVHDANFAKKAVAVFWREYSTSSGRLSLADSFDWYINTKATEKHKINNARLQGYVGAGEAWQRAMNSQRSSWEKSTQRQDEYILKRGAYRAILNAQAAVDAAERAIQ